MGLCVLCLCDCVCFVCDCVEVCGVMLAALSAPVGKSVSLVWQRRSRRGETGVRGLEQ